MAEQEHGFHPEDLKFEHNITEAYSGNSPENFINYLSHFNQNEALVLHLHVSEVNFDTVTFLINNFPNAKVEIAATRNDYILYKNKLPISVDWKVA